MQEGKKLTKAFGRGIAQRRAKLRYSQETVAKKVGIRQESLSRIGKGVIALKFERLQPFADALGCSVMELFRFDEGTA